MTPLWAMALVVFATFLGAGGALFFKFASKDFSLNPGKILRNKNFWLAGLLYGFSTVFFVTALKFGELSVLYPITALSYVWVTLLSMQVLKEKMNLFKWFGISSVILGVILVAI